MILARERGLGHPLEIFSRKELSRSEGRAPKNLGFAEIFWLKGTRIVIHSILLFYKFLLK